MTTYSYIPSIDYINDLTFDYVETYSLQRGAEYEESNKLLQAEYNKIKVRKNKHSNLTIEEEERFIELHGLFGFTQYLINDKGRFHPSGKKTNTFKHNDPYSDRIRNILQTEIIEVPQWMCAPVYRDAIVFYDHNAKIISTLNICLTCQFMETEKFHHINADYKTYDLFKRFFMEIGHEVEEPDYFIMDEINKLKAKNKKS